MCNKLRKAFFFINNSCMDRKLWDWDKRWSNLTLWGIFKEHVCSLCKWLYIGVFKVVKANECWALTCWLDANQRINHYNTPFSLYTILNLHSATTATPLRQYNVQNSKTNQYLMTYKMPNDTSSSLSWELEYKEASIHIASLNNSNIPISH